MKIKMKKLQGQLSANADRRMSMEDIASATGIDAAALFNMSSGKTKSIRLEYLDALCAISGLTPGELLEAEPVTLPLPAIRPDRRGAQVGQKTKED
jgi:DNA-binding Xre family transcriptional regulator